MQLRIRLGLLALTIFSFALPARGAGLANVEEPAPPKFDIDSGPLADALDRFGDQSGLQIVYDPHLLDGRQASAVTGQMRRREALDRLLAGSGLVWKQVNDMTVMLFAPDRARDVARRRRSTEAKPDEPTSWRWATWRFPRTRCACCRTGPVPRRLV
jgi:hypothetical protein